MAHGLKCYCCWEKETSDTHYYCYECIKKLKHIFEVNRAVFDDVEYEILENPHHSAHCYRCCEWENRRIIDEKFICDKCVMEELKDYELEAYQHLWTTEKDNNFLAKVDDGYLPVHYYDGQLMALIIEDDILAEQVIEKMINAGCKIIE